MEHSRETRWLRRRFLVSGLSLFGSALALGSASLLSGCGGEDKSAGQLENVKDPTKTQDGMDSMKAFMEEQKKRSGKRK
jgi:hypothetical protein